MPPVRLALLTNEHSGAGTAGEAARCLEQAGADVERVDLASFCDGPGAFDAERMERVAARLAGQAASGGDERGGAERGRADRVVVAGGDGSIGPAAALAARAGLPLAVVPAGTANDFARWLDLPLELDEACALAADAGAATRPLELASAAGRPFVNAASTGLSVLAAERAQPLKSWLGPLAYPAGAFRAGLTGRPLELTVVADGEEAWRGRAWQVVVAATGAFGAGARTGGVDPDDHHLDVAIVEAGPRIALLRRAWGMRTGRLVDQDAVRHVRGRTVELDVDRAFNIDGELLRVGENGSSTFGIDGAFDVVIPR